MADQIPPVGNDQSSSGGSTVALFLSLFLLVLAFFILMVTISTLEKVKTQSVMNSLTSTFASIVPPSTDPTRFKSREGSIVAGLQFQREVTELFATAIQVAKTRIVHPGRLMQVRIPSDVLFFPGEVNVRPAQREMLDRIVAALSGRPPGLRFDMEFVVGTPPLEGRKLPEVQTLEVARGGAFARQMINRGLPPDSIAVGISQAHPDEVVIWFYIRREEEVKLHLDQPPAKGGGG